MEKVQCAQEGSRPVLCNSWDIDCWDTRWGEERRVMALDFPQMCGGPT